MDTPAIASCGCISHNECCSCFKPVCNGKPDQSICDECYINLNEKNKDGKIIRPIKRTPITMCNCGKPWNPECSRLGLFHNFGGGVYVVDPVKLAACKTPEERRNLMKDSSAMIKLDGSQHFPVKQ